MAKIEILKAAFKIKPVTWTTYLDKTGATIHYIYSLGQMITVTESKFEKDIYDVDVQLQSRSWNILMSCKGLDNAKDYVERQHYLNLSKHLEVVTLPEGVSYE